MKRISYLTIISLIILLSSCTKERNEKSVWYVNGDKFSTRAFTTHTVYNIDSGVDECFLQYDEFENGKTETAVYFGFFAKKLPTSGEISIKRDYARNGRIFLVYKYRWYMVSPHQQGKIKASSYKGKAKLEVDPVWFTSSTEGDSVLFSGTFYEPLYIEE
jgi:hypothetical protein